MANDNEDSGTGFRFKISGRSLASTLKACGIGVLGWVALFLVDEVRGFYRDRAEFRQRIIAIEQRQQEVIVPRIVQLENKSAVRNYRAIKEIPYE